MRLEGHRLMYIPYRFGSNLPGTVRNLKCRRMLRVLVTKNALTWCFLIAAVIPSLASIDWFITKKRRNLYLLPSFCQRLLALPYNGGRQRRSPTLVYAIKTSACIPPGTPCRMQDNYISTGIYRCSILDHCMNFARIPDSQESALINAFIMFHLPPSIPDRGFGRSASANIHNFIMEAERFMIFLLYICIYET